MMMMISRLVLLIVCCTLISALPTHHKKIRLPNIHHNIPKKMLPIKHEQVSEGPDDIFMFEEPSEGPDDIFMPENFHKNKANEAKPRIEKMLMPQYFNQQDTEEASEGPDHIYMPHLSPKKPVRKIPNKHTKHSKTLEEKLALLNDLSNSLRFNMDIDPTSDAPELVEPTVEEATSEALFLRTSLPTDPLDDMGSTCYEMQHPNLNLHCAHWLYNNYHTVNSGWAQCSAFTDKYAPKCGYWWAKCKKNPRNKHCCISAHCHAKAKYGVNFGK